MTFLVLRRDIVTETPGIGSYLCVLNNFSADLNLRQNTMQYLFQWLGMGTLVPEKFGGTIGI